MNIRQEISIPDCFNIFRGGNTNNAVVNETEEYALGFGEMSKFDEKTLNIFKEFSARLSDEEFNGREPRSFFDMIHDYLDIVEGLDEPFIWEKVVCN